ncbi:MAG: hypothetical protein Tsb009_03790 [Planctomycetaceae bacterium]
MVTIDERGNIETVNPAASRIFGYERNELIGQNVSMLMPSPDREKHATYLRNYLETGEAKIIGIGREAMGVRKDGSEFPLELSVSELRINGQRLFTAIIRDITERKQVEEELRQREHQFRFMVENLPAGAVFVDRVHDALIVNRAVEDITGYSAEELGTLDQWFERLFGKNAERERSLYEQNHEIGFRSEDVSPIQCKNGGIRYVDFAGYRYDHHEVWLIHDVTEKRLAEESLRAERDFAESLVQTAHAIVLVLDPNGCIVRFNPFFEELSGYSLEEVQGRNWFTTFLPERDREQIQSLFSQVLDNVSVEGNVNPILTQAGEEREISWWAKTLKDANGNVNGVLCIGHDITDLRNAQQQLVQSERLAAIGQMMTGLAHESRNALQRAQACLDMLELDILGMELPDKNSGELLDLTHRGQAALDELHRLYEEVRSYASPIRIDYSDCNLQTLWRNVWDNLQAAHSDLQVHLDENVEDGSTGCRVDAHKISQVFRNILENAIAVSPTGGTITIRCANTDIQNRPAVRISIRDQGPGLDSRQQQKIFEPFFTTKSKGTGLGMAIAKRIVESHNGTISVSQDCETGAEICLTLPKDSE